MTTTRSTSRRWWLFAAAMLALSLAGFAHVLSQTGTTSPGHHEPVPAPQEASRQVVCMGHADLENGVHKVYPLTPGRVADVLVREGEMVAADAPLLRIEDKVNRLRADEAKLSVQVAEQELTEVRKKPEQHKALVEQQRIAVSAAKKRAEVLRNVLERKKELQTKGLGGVSAIDLEVTQGELAGAELAIQAEDWKLKVLQLQDPLAEARLVEMKLAVAKARLEQAQAASDEYTIRAPKAGSVLRVMVAKGDTLSSSSQQPAMWFAPEETRIIRAEVEQSSAHRVAEGQVARIEDDAHGGGTWTGRVVRISDWYTHKRSILQEPLQFNDVRTLECIVALDPGQPKPKIGQRVRVFIQTTK